jgi:iron complex outermembrane receptor protein
VPANVRAGGERNSSDLHFGALAILNLRLVANLGQIEALTNASPFFKDARLSLRVDNICDARQKVTDANGAVPLSYQPDLLDPKGRFVAIEFRKMF